MKIAYNPSPSNVGFEKCKKNVRFNFDVFVNEDQRSLDDNLAVYGNMNDSQLKQLLSLRHDQNRGKIKHNCITSKRMLAIDSIPIPK
jgi:hypothetical protein